MKRSTLPLLISISSLLLVLASSAHAQIGLDFLNLPADAKIGTILSRFYVFGVSMTAIAALIMFTIGGVRYMISGDHDPGPAKDQMKNALFGLILALTSYLILYTINPDLVREVKTTEIIDLKQQQLVSQQAGEGERCGGTPVDPQHPESVQCGADLTCFQNPLSLTDCKPALGNITGNCLKSCPAKVPHGGTCLIDNQCANTIDLCRIKTAEGCKHVNTAAAEPGKCLDVLCN
ncbi:MAG: hypothetical protein HYT41_02795 [Candidatus Sungbacteria bacterium]|nr:hypothetical protein [Candidatus Sungbacteria bacterium]